MSIRQVNLDVEQVNEFRATTPRAFVKIVGLLENDDWYYMACNKKVEYVKDTTESTTLTIIEQNAERLPDYTALDHVEYEAYCQEMNQQEKVMK
ncbi:hypothetical protein MKW98_004771, partial [Papaver atlanticum]